MSVLQAILIGCYYWMKHNLYGYGWGCCIFLSPLPAALWVGIVLGNVPLAMTVGALLQLMYLGIFAPGANLPADPVLATLISTAVVIQTNVPAETAVSMAVPLALIGTLAWNSNRAINVTWAHLADKYAKEANTRGIYLSGLVWPTLARIPTHIIPVALAVYYGPKYMSAILESFPPFVMHGLEVIAGMMPAVGFAIVLSVIGQKKLLPYFFAGFFIAQYFGLGAMALAIFGVLIAYIHVLLSSGNKEGGEVSVS